MTRAALPGLLVVLGFGSFILLALVLLLAAGDGLPFERLALLAIPYVLLSLAVVLLVIVFPDLALWLPHTVMGTG